VKNVLKSLLN